MVISSTESKGDMHKSHKIVCKCWAVLLHTKPHGSDCFTKSLQALSKRQLYGVSLKRTEILIFGSEKTARWFSSAVESKNYYDVLGIRKESTLKEIKSAFYEKSKLLHPDTNVDAGDAHIQAFIELKSAYEILSCNPTRAEYDNYLTSLEKSKLSFDEWKLTYKTDHRSTVGKQYKSEHDSQWHEGSDMQWKDFTIWDLCLVLILIGMVVFVIRTEDKLKHIRHFRTKMHESKYDQRAINHLVLPAHIRKGAEHKESLKTSEPTEEKVFDEIRRTGQVSDDAIQALKDTKDNCSDKNGATKINLQTWS
uniref:DnaJ homolog subfamily C member 18-like n=1 Tax=Phallusia mammillata TaxID=59560 RepID=A0A6F9DBY8_9ASCI|nr:dnaJ homolog subfamily C member 18-like [Phallusia mammillata]